MERFEHHPLSPAGQVDAWGDLAAGLRYNRAGRRRALGMLAWLLVVLAALSVVTVLLG